MEWNDTAAAYPSDRCLHELFAEQAEKTPDAVAVVSPHEGVTLTYRELDARAGALAGELRRSGLAGEERVGMLIERSASFVVGLLATLKAGGVHVPIDPDTPAERIAFLVEDARIAVLLARRENAGRVPPGVQVRWTDEWPSSGTAPAARSGPDSLAYVMYTSGSTGRPKGVAISHRAAVRMVRGVDYMSWGPDDAVLLLAATVFDVSCFELWGALLSGSRVVAYPSGPLDPDELGRFLREHRITTALMTSGLFQLMVDQRLPDLGGLRQLMAGGDVLSPQHARRVLDAFPGLRLLNGYGPTEAATMSTVHLVRAGGDPRGPGLDRPPGAQHARLRARRPSAAGAGRRAGRAVRRRRWPGARLPRSPGAHRGGVHPRSVRARRQPSLSHR